VPTPVVRCQEIPRCCTPAPFTKGGVWALMLARMGRRPLRPSAQRAGTARVRTRGLPAARTWRAAGPGGRAEVRVTSDEVRSQRFCMEGRRPRRLLPHNEPGRLVYVHAASRRVASRASRATSGGRGAPAPLAVASSPRTCSPARRDGRGALRRLQWRSCATDLQPPSGGRTRSSAAPPLAAAPSFVL